ncbi:unnamed protein product, partial [Rotaria socialis]
MADCEMYDPSSNIWTPIMNMSFPRHGHTATVLSSGHVLVTGGDNHDDFSTSEIYDPLSKMWTPA